MKHYDVPLGLYRMKHYRTSAEMVLTDHDGSPGHPPVELTEVCEATYPAGVCPCRAYRITWGQEGR